MTKAEETHVFWLKDGLCVVSLQFYCLWGGADPRAEMLSITYPQVLIFYASWSGQRMCRKRMVSKHRSRTSRYQPAGHNRDSLQIADEPLIIPRRIDKSFTDQGFRRAATSRTRLCVEFRGGRMGILLQDVEYGIRMLSRSSHSQRSATIGSTLAARRAGK